MEYIHAIPTHQAIKDQERIRIRPTPEQGPERLEALLTRNMEKIPDSSYILVCSSNRGDQETAKKLFGESQTYTTSDPKALVEIAKNQRDGYAFIELSYDQGKNIGLEMIQELQDSDVKVVLWTWEKTPHVEAIATRLGAYKTIAKDELEQFALDELLVI